MLLMKTQMIYTKERKDKINTNIGKKCVGKTLDKNIGDKQSISEDKTYKMKQKHTRLSLI